LAVPPLPDAVRALLESAPVVDLAASQPLAMAELDERFEDGWVGVGQRELFCAAMRMTGFVNLGRTDGLVFQSLVTGLGSDDVSIEFHRFGFAMVPESGWWREILDEDTAARLAETLGEVTVQMPNGEVRARLAKHPEFGDALSRLETMMLTLTADWTARDRVFLTGDQIKHALTLAAIAQPLFVLDSWHHPAAGETGSDAVDLFLAIEALRSRRAVAASLTGKSRDDHVRERLNILG
jgi:hypothetical protein